MESSPRVADCPVAFVTATYGRDIERFALQRLALQRFAPDIPHHVVVESEDLPLFARRFGAQRGLQLIATRALLPPLLETLRSRSRFWHRADWLWALSKRVRTQGHFDGYHSQQLVKLGMARCCGAQRVVVLDSDVVLTCPTTSDELLADTGHPLPICPWQEQGDPRQFVAWRDSTLQLLGLPATLRDSSFACMAMPFPIDRSLLEAMIAYLESRHGIDWREALARCPTYSEFFIYGSYCRHLAAADTVTVGELPAHWSHNHWDEPVLTELQDYFAGDAPLACRFFHLQSMLKRVDHAAAARLVGGYLERH